MPELITVMSALCLYLMGYQVIEVALSLVHLEELPGAEFTLHLANTHNG